MRTIEIGCKEARHGICDEFGEEEQEQICSNCEKVFNIFIEGSTDKPDLCDKCWCEEEVNQ